MPSRRIHGVNAASDTGALSLKWAGYPAHSSNNKSVFPEHSSLEGLPFSNVAIGW
jgi:hypothetical protein